MEAIFANPQRRVGIADTTPAFQYSSPKGGIADYSGSNGLLSPSNLSPYFDAIAGALQAPRSGTSPKRYSLSCFADG